MNIKNSYTIGVDFGSDSVRALLINALTGEYIRTSESRYTRWSKGLYSDGTKAIFRQNPLDYLEGLEDVLKDVVSHCPEPEGIQCISVDTTCSTPCLVDKHCTPLSLLEKHKENPDAMFVLWKDHSAEKEATEINDAIKDSGKGYAAHLGGNYSAECFWAKVLKTLRHSPDLIGDACTAIELCDWIPAVLTGVDDISKMKSGLCAAGAKRLWAKEWGGYPPEEFFNQIDALLVPILRNMPDKVYGCDKAAGVIAPDWADRLHLPQGVLIGIGNIDSHSGAVGAGITYGTMAMNLGTSACFMAVTPPNPNVIEGIFGQVDGSILPGMTGYEVGMSAFGDIFAWLKRILGWAIGSDNNAQDSILQRLSEEAVKLEIMPSSPISTGYLNGRRSPNPDSSLTCTITGLTLGTTPVEIYYALAESAAFGAKASIDHLIKNGVFIERLVAIGGIAFKSPFIMQLMADANMKKIEVLDCKQSCALGAAINASVVAGLYPDVPSAQKALCPSSARTYIPSTERHELLEIRYSKYLELAKLK